MAECLLLKGGGGSGSDDVTATTEHVLMNRTAITKESDDEPIAGIMPDNTTTTSNGTVPGMSSSYPSVPSRTGLNMQINTNTDGVKRISICPPKGYYQGGNGSYVSIPASDLGTAAVNQVLSSATFTSENGLKISGTIPIKSAATYTPGTTSQVIAAGQYLNGTQTIDSLGGTATAAQVLSGYTFSSNNAGRAVSGTIPIKSAATYTPGATAQVIAAGQYLSGAQIIAARPAGWYDSATQQTVFNYGSYGNAANMGAFYTNSTYVWSSDATRPAVMNEANSMYLGGTNPTYRVIFRQAFPLEWKWAYINWFTGVSNRSITIFVINPSTMLSVGSRVFTVTTPNTGGNGAYIDLSTYVSQCTNGWFLGFAGDFSNMVSYGLRTVILGPTQPVL